MATLVSPGVDVQIIDESYYGSAGAGTIPLIILATAANKASPTGTGIAPYSVPSQAGKLFLATSQRELIQNFGNPTFYSVQGTQLHGYELNEYGLHAAYQYLGISNRAYVIRADIDLAALEASETAPTSPPAGGTYWFDLNETRFGVFQSNGNKIAGSAWLNQPTLIADGTDVVVVGSTYTPAPSFGNEGDFAVVTATSANLTFEKINGTWYQIGTAGWRAARPTTILGVANPGNVLTTDAILLNSVTVTFNIGTGTLAEVVAAINAANIPNITASVGNTALEIKNTVGGTITIANQNGTPLSTLGITAGTYFGPRVFYTNDASYPAGSNSGDVWVKGTSPNRGALWVVKRYDANLGQWVTMSTPHYPFDSLLNDGDSAKDLAALQSMGVPTVGNLYVGFDPATGAQQLRRWSGTRWEVLSYFPQKAEPSNPPEHGALWFDKNFRVDIMVGDGSKWVGYRRRYPDTNPTGVIIAGSAPVEQTDGTSLVDNDIWLDSSDEENYPAMYRYDATASKWRRIDNTDQTTPFGVVFADARQNSGPAFTGMPNAGAYVYNSEAIEDMLISDFIEPDAPDARLHPDGMLLFNTRYSNNNVKVWYSTYFNDGDTSNGEHVDPNTDYTLVSYNVGEYIYYTFPPMASAGAWVTISGNRADGSPYMGRKAQRIMVVKAMAKVVNQNDDLRSELVYFNIMAAPGYPELIDEMITLNVDQKEVSFIIGDTPSRLDPSGTSVQAWATNANGAVSNGEDGLTSANTYVGIYYPWALSTNIDGSEVMVPPSTVALRTFAYNDQVAYPWFAPAGFQRGLVTNATTVGYLTAEGEFHPVILNNGQRDVLYLNKINPIAYIPNRGLVVFGQKSLHPYTSALDRVNVARLTNYLRYNLDNLVKPFLFEQNDQQTRDAARITCERFLTGLIGLRALEDFAVICDETNNTPERRDRNELWIDILIKPLKAIEFIYIPVRIRNSGSDLSLAQVQ